MKLMITLVLASFLAAYSYLGSTSHDKYCAKMRDGVRVVMYQGKPITADVMLSNGTRVLTNGTIIKPNGTKLMLNEGECITKDGIIVMEQDHDKIPERK